MSQPQVHDLEKVVSQLSKDFREELAKCMAIRLSMLSGEPFCRNEISKHERILDGELARFGHFDTEMNTLASQFRITRTRVALSVFQERMQLISSFSLERENLRGLLFHTSLVLSQKRSRADTLVGLFISVLAAVLAATSILVRIFLAT